MLIAIAKCIFTSVTNTVSTWVEWLLECLADDDGRGGGGGGGRITGGNGGGSGDDDGGVQGGVDEEAGEEEENDDDDAEMESWERELEVSSATGGSWEARGM